MPNWLVLVIVGLIIYGLSLAPITPVSWKAFMQWIGGVLAVIGIVLLVLVLLRIPLPGT